MIAAEIARLKQHVELLNGTETAKELRDVVDNLAELVAQYEAKMATVSPWIPMSKYRELIEEKSTRFARLIERHTGMTERQCEGTYAELLGMP